ncbi:hypothetical protein C8F04DRAFT_1396093 [Mycena alexandri]|uniref:KOW domain-containing protein n=1 Tax=Mycena alexandri TaxID=1745969 RepID=A0AAD6STN1_9AGAR|nr:hypothetical protein C8F04DRAFT_1396093 [Mycena alexandri]
MAIIENSTRQVQCRGTTPQVNDDLERPRKRARVTRTSDARRFLDTEAREGDGSEDEDDLAFLNDSEREPTSLRPRGLDSQHRDEDGETLAALAQQYELRARAERAAVRGAGVSEVERVEERLAEIRNAPADEFGSNINFRSRYRWGRLKEGKGDAKVGQLALVESGRAVLVLLPQEGQRWKLARLVVSAGSSLDKALSSEPPPSQEELAQWDAAHGGVLQSALHPGPSMAVGVSSRVVVKWPDSAHHDKSGFVVAEDEQKGEAMVRLSLRGEAVRTWHPRLWETLTNGSKEEVEDIVVPRWTLRRHLLSVSDELRGLDRVRVLGGLSAGIVGRVRAIDWSENDPEVTIWVVDGEREMKATMTEVRREFMRGDLVQVVAGPSTGNRGIIVGRADAGVLEIYTGLSAGSTQADLSTAERGAAAQRRRARVVGDLSSSELEKIKLGKVSAGELGVMAAATLGTVAQGELAMAEVEDVALRSMVCVLEDHVGFEQGEQRVGGWTLPSVTTGDAWAKAMCAADKRREEKEKKAMKGGKQFRGQPVWIVKPHAMKGRRGMVIDNHWTMGAGGVLTMVLTLRIEVTNAPVQVPEDQARHEGTGLPLRQAMYVTPWAGPLQLGFTNDEDEWEGRRTPEWEDGTTPMGDAWRPTQGEMAVAAAAAARAATRIGEDNGRWLCIPRLQGKRVDVRVRLKTAGKRVSGAQVAAAGQSGFIELSHALTESALNTPMSVRVGEFGKKVQIEPRWLIPVRTTLNPPWNNADASIVTARERVVIIGPDEAGERDREGDYAETCPNTEQTGNVVWVRFERVEGVDGEWRKYPVESLCRSLNQDGTFTRKSRF